MNFAGKNAYLASQFGTLYVQTDKPSYFAGEEITGTLFLNLQETYPADKIKIKIKGKERTLLIWFEDMGPGPHHHHPPPDRRPPWDRPHGPPRRRMEHIEREDAPCIYHVHTVFDAKAGGPMPPGQYSFPFSFKLPLNIPGTFHHVEQNLSASIRYTIEGFIETVGNLAPRIKYKSRFTVRQPPMVSGDSVGGKSTTKVVCCGCCLPYGTVDIRANFEKNVYQPNETARAQIEVDNSHSSVDLKDIRLELRQTITIKARYRTETRTQVVASSTGLNFLRSKEKSTILQESMVLPPSPNVKDIFNFDIGFIKNAPMFSKQFISSTTTGKLIQSTFVLNVRATSDALCTNDPEVNTPCHIIYPDYQLPIWQKPPEWHPKVYAPVVIAVQPESGYAQLQSGYPMAQASTSSNTMVNYGTMQSNNVTLSGGYPTTTQASAQQTTQTNTQQNGQSNVTLVQGYPQSNQQGTTQTTTNVTETTPLINK